MEERFRKFLREKDLTRKFLHGCKNARLFQPISIEGMIHHCTKLDNWESIFKRAFVWGMSKEGIEFWENVNEEWQRELYL